MHLRVVPADSGGEDRSSCAGGTALSAETHGPAMRADLRVARTIPGQSRRSAAQDEIASLPPVLRGEVGLAYSSFDHVWRAEFSRPACRAQRIRILHERIARQE